MSQPDTFLSPALTALFDSSGFTANSSASGTWWYDLTPMLRSGEEAPAREHESKFSLFVTPTKFTLVANSYENKTVGEDTPKEHTFKQWRKHWSIVLSAKENQGTPPAFNIYLHMAGKGLKNYTSHPNKFAMMIPRELHGLMLACAQDLFERRLGRTWKKVPGAGETNEHFVHTLLYNTYPGFFTDLETLKQRTPLFLNQTAGALYPLLREPDTAKTVENMFGADSPPELREAAEVGLSPQLLTAGYLFGGRIPAQQIFDRITGMTGEIYRFGCLKEMRQLLNRCDDESLLALFESYATTKGRANSLTRKIHHPLVPVDKLLQDVSQDTRMPKGLLFRRIPVLRGIKDFAQLQAALREQINQQREAQITVRSAQSEELSALVAGFLKLDSVDDGQIGYWLKFEDQQLKLCFRQRAGGPVEGLNLMQFHEDFRNPGELLVASKLAGPRTVLPARHSLYAFFARQRAAGVVQSIPKRHDWVQVNAAKAAEFIAGFLSCLQRITKRNGLADTPANRSAVFGLLYLSYHEFPVYDMTGHKRERPAVPKHLYAYLRDGVDPEATLLGLRWRLTPQEAVRYQQLPESFLRELSRKSPYVRDEFEAAF